MPTVARILFLADTHLGLDLPFHPRVEKTRRGPDFFANFRRALRPALDGQADLVIHGGDLFYRSRIPPALVEMAMEPLVAVAERGVPVFLVPGNHERSHIPLHLWTLHPLLHIFDRPRTFTLRLGDGDGPTLALSGFPAGRGNVRDLFAARVEETGWRHVAADARLLCMHEVVEGAQVGDTNYTFRSGPQVMRGEDVPGDFGAALSGHIHRAKVLRRDLEGLPLAAPVVYPGAIERTAFVERLEAKGYIRLTMDLDGPARGQVSALKFVRLPMRPMVHLVLDVGGLQRDRLEAHLQERLGGLEANAIVRIQLRGRGAEDARLTLTAARLRALAPPTVEAWVAPESAT
ncbi:MAG: metallophosphoesterase [Chloroflexota bacterium]|nr:metallophosphoesterase [Chloroflexota bacterium]